MKPHVEDWGSEKDFEVTVVGPELDRGRDAPREKLARLAPRLARALLLYVRHCEMCNGKGALRVWDGMRETTQPCTDCADARAVLTEAGVLP